MSSDSEQPVQKKQKKESDDAEHTQRTLSTCNFSDQISVVVGPSEQPFLVHKDIICAKSKFFAAACSERWVEGKEKKVTLPEAKASAFQSYLVWVYCGKVDVTCISSEDFDYLPTESGKIEAKNFELCFLGDAFDDIRLRNRVLENLILDINEFNNILFPSIVTRVWEKTPENSPVRKMMVDLAYLRGHRTFLLDNLTRFPQDFVQQVAAALLQEIPAKDSKVFKAKLPLYLEPVETVD